MPINKKNISFLTVSQYIIITAKNNIRMTNNIISKRFIFLPYISLCRYF